MLKKNTVVINVIIINLWFHVLILDPADFSLLLDKKVILPSIPVVIGLIEFIYIAVALKSSISK